MLFRLTLYDPIGLEKFISDDGWNNKNYQSDEEIDENKAKLIRHATASYKMNSILGNHCI